ncbi:hypothetical protein O6P43_017498 [Quillaja saponaria]|uniref:Uncharacterized protein n=1 Tax=Quillaja saponaria TaxID=32244 RepID=A0AAD7LQ22_QUISA|nr:hypothetical protein O6P43_017498 [Quillaja saponaria]
MEVPSDSGTGEGGGPQKLIDKGKKMMVKEDSENFTIGFRVNPNSARNPVITTGKSCFTEAQRRELEHQALIFQAHSKWPPYSCVPCATHLE